MLMIQIMETIMEIMITMNGDNNNNCSNSNNKKTYISIHNTHTYIHTNITTHIQKSTEVKT